MYTIHDIIPYLDFSLISKNIDVEIAYADSQPSVIFLSELKGDDVVFEYTPSLRDTYTKKYNKDEVVAIVEEILEDVAKEYYEQTSLIHAILLGEEKFKDKRE